MIFRVILKWVEFSNVEVTQKEIALEVESEDRSDGDLDELKCLARDLGEDPVESPNGY